MDNLLICIIVISGVIIWGTINYIKYLIGVNRSAIINDLTSEIKDRYKNNDIPTDLNINQLDIVKDNQKSDQKIKLI